MLSDPVSLGSIESPYCRQLPGPLVYGSNYILNGIHFAFLKVCFSALCANPGRDGIEYQVITLAVHVERGSPSLHSALAMTTVHKSTN